MSGDLESALLVGILKAPTELNPRTKPARCAERQRSIIERLRSSERVTQEEAAAALMQSAVLPPYELPLARAPKTFVMSIVAGSDPPPARLDTTLDAHLQADVERAIQRDRPRLSELGATQCAVVVIDTPTGDLLAMSGALPEVGPEGPSFVNGALAPRQAGSALKPFLYAMALEGPLGPESVLTDLPVTYDEAGREFSPRNFDRQFHGFVRLRDALAGSLNVASVDALNQVGVARFLETLRALHLDTIAAEPARYGLGLALGDAEVRLLDLTSAYAALARGGLWRPPRVVQRAQRFDGGALPLSAIPSPVRVFTEEASKQVEDILSDEHARFDAFGPHGRLGLPFRAAVKTGTSSGARDLWAFGFTHHVTVGVWVGNFDGHALHSGAFAMEGAAPLLADVLAAVEPAPAAQ